MMAAIINKSTYYISQSNKNDVIAALNRPVVYSAAAVITASILGLGAHMMLIKSNCLYPDRGHYCKGLRGAHIRHGADYCPGAYLLLLTS